jgi:hypothetical protein
VSHARLTLALALATALSFPSIAAAQTDCFDAEVSARIVRQTPSVMPTDVPGCEGCIIMRWPWFVELEVQRVHSGAVERGLLSVLTVQHTYYSRGAPRRWLLRRNTMESWNVVHSDQGAPLPRCGADSKPVSPYIRPADGQTLDDLRREGEEHYGPDPYA